MTKSKIYLSERIWEKDMGDRYPVSIITVPGYQYDGYATKAQINRIMGRAKIAKGIPAKRLSWKHLAILFVVLAAILIFSLSIAYPAESQMNSTEAGAIQFGNVTNFGTISVVTFPGQSESVPLPETAPPETDAENDIEAAEGLRLTPYTGPGGAVHIGYGRNLTNKGITQTEAEMLFENDLAEAQADLSGNIFAMEWSGLPDEIKPVLINMRYQLGPGGFRKFGNMIAAVRIQDWTKIAAEMRDSIWAEQTPRRARLLIKIVESITTKKGA